MLNKKNAQNVLQDVEEKYSSAKSKRMKTNDKKILSDLVKDILRACFLLLYKITN